MKKIVQFASLLSMVSTCAMAQAPATMPGPAQAAGPPADELPLAVAMDWAQAAIAACKANSYNVTATYMNKEMGVKLVLRSDGARPGTVDIGRRKAYTALKTGMSSADFATSLGITASNPAPKPEPGKPPGLPPGDNTDQNLIVFAGGELVKVAGKIVGAVSVSGAPGGEKDVVCVDAGLAKIADKLK